MCLFSPLRVSNSKSYFVPIKDKILPEMHFARVRCLQLLAYQTAGWQKFQGWFLFFPSSRLDYAQQNIEEADWKALGTAWHGDTEKCVESSFSCYMKKPFLWALSQMDVPNLSSRCAAECSFEFFKTLRKDFFLCFLAISLGLLSHPVRSQVYSGKWEAASTSWHHPVSGANRHFAKQNLP